jgi:hypothetical protein
LLSWPWWANSAANLEGVLLGPPPAGAAAAWDFFFGLAMSGKFRDEILVDRWERRK